MQKKFANLCRSILSDKNTRNLFFFLVINLIFAFVELTYGLWTNSLGLISDSFHMFFDCSALLLGLGASLIAKWKPNDKFTYGFGRAEILTGLANGLFLLFIAFFIMKEAIERTFEPPEVHHERLFIISVLGFLVNLVGIFVFQHGGQGHHHGSGGCTHSHKKLASHNHSHTWQNDYKYDNLHGYSHYSNPSVVGEQDQQACQLASSITLDMNGHTPNTLATHFSASTYPHSMHGSGSNHHEHSDQHPFLPDNHDHDHGHHHHHNHGESRHRGQIMQSVFLHIVADTLGSVGVMISAVLMNQFGWMIADPLCSLFIAILISISVYPLLKDSIFILMQRVPVDLEHKLTDCLTQIQALDGVLNVHDVHIWTLNSDIYIGCLKLEVNPSANSSMIQKTAEKLMNHIGVNKVHVQLDYAN